MNPTSGVFDIRLVSRGLSRILRSCFIDLGFLEMLIEFRFTGANLDSSSKGLKFILIDIPQISLKTHFEKNCFFVRSLIFKRVY